MKITLNLSPAASARDRYALVWAIPATLIGLAVLFFLGRATLQEYRDYRVIRDQLAEVQKRTAELQNEEVVAQLPAPVADRLPQRLTGPSSTASASTRTTQPSWRPSSGWPRCSRLDVVAEGVETRGQLEVLVGDGMPDGPGFLVLRALGGRRHGTVPHRRGGCVRALGDGEVTSSMSSQPPAANSSTRRWASSSRNCTGGDFMK